MPAPEAHDITGRDALERLYGLPAAASIRKEVDFICKPCRREPLL